MKINKFQEFYLFCYKFNNANGMKVYNILYFPPWNAKIESIHIICKYINNYKCSIVKSKVSYFCTRSKEIIHFHFDFIILWLQIFLKIKYMSH